MPEKTVICLWFDTEAEEAARYYTSIWPDAEIIGTVRYGVEDPAREGTALTVQWPDGQSAGRWCDRSHRSWPGARRSPVRA